ncbi:hypothetical protein C5167_040990 [Papaver somniferum]|uniref:Uncharacterized protein n=1 Tax=Papaver somniferum TaxID=3469 RepID=A0A4Y7IJZ4_PAPSO|nr:hypothetical protein C5167_040990 [Papaver somniferum]
MGFYSKIHVANKNLNEEDNPRNIDTYIQHLKLVGTYKTLESQSVIPSISNFPETLRRISPHWAQCLIGKVMRRTVGYKFLKDRACALMETPWRSSDAGFR